jgi:hypothetical protein
MDNASTRTDTQGLASVSRLGGLAIIVGLGIHIVLNGVLKEFPPVDPTLTELQAYLAREAGAWTIIHGFRYLAFACIALFAAGLFSRTCCTRAVHTTGWGVLGLLGAAVFVTNGIITNGIEILAFHNDALVAQNQEGFWLLFRLTRVLFTAEIVTWSILILGFSVAGWRSGTLPRWLAAIGLLQVVAGMLTGVFVVSILSDGLATVIVEVASIAGLVWFLCAGVYLLIQGDSV